MKNMLSIGIFTLVIVVSAFAQEKTLELKKCVTDAGNCINTDNLGNIYILDKSSLRKYDAEGNLIYTYTELSDGLISAVDVSDPLKIIIFNADFGKIKFLDSKLSLKKDPISLPDLGFSSPSLVAASYENGFWIFDPLSNQLVRFDTNLHMSQSSGNISDLAGHEFKPVQISEYNNMVYANDPRYGIFVFDRYATYMKTIPLKNIKTFQVFNDRIFYLEKNVIRSLELKTYEETALRLTDIGEEIISAAIDNQKITVLTKTKFCLFKYR